MSDVSHRFSRTETATGPWSTPASSTPTRRAWDYWRPVRIGVFVALSPLTSFTDPWGFDRGRQSAPTAMVVLEGSVRKRISLRAAHQSALELMKRIEASRLIAAEKMAQRAFRLEDTV